MTLINMKENQDKTSTVEITENINDNKFFLTFPEEYISS